MDELQACSKIVFWKHCEPRSKLLEVTWLLPHLHTLEIKVCSSSHIVEPNWQRLWRCPYQTLKVFGGVTSLSQDPITVTEKQAVLAVWSSVSHQHSVWKSNTSVMCSEYVSTAASVVCFALQPKRKGKLKSSWMCHQALGLHDFCLLWSLSVACISSRAQEETCFQISAELSSSFMEIIIIGINKCSGMLSGTEGDWTSLTSWWSPLTIKTLDKRVGWDISFLVVERKTDTPYYKPSAWLLNHVWPHNV